ncbi:hypothetical protein LshimejAT787_5900020, partial [Lyophyllum shimeji]
MIEGLLIGFVLDRSYLVLPLAGMKPHGFLKLRPTSYWLRVAVCKSLLQRL